MADLRASGLGGVPKGTTANRPSSPSIGDVYYNGTLAATEIYTSSGWVVMGAVPQAATIGSPSVTLNRAYNSPGVDVSFTPSSSGGLASSYTVTSSPGGITATGSSSPVTITGINNTTAYTFSVIASNAYGNSIASSSSNSITTFTLPDAPTIGTATKINTGLSVTFTAPNNGGSAITNYKYSVDGGATYTALSPAQTSSPLTITGLTNGQSYSARIKAVNANGDSVASAASNSVVPDNFPNTIEMLVVAGGGGGGGNLGGGGGAGGLIYNSSLATLPSTTYTVTVGAGGSGGSSGVVGSIGNNSVFGSQTAIAGGFGGKSNTAAGPGGSGGGSGTTTAALGTSGQGNNGGTVNNFVAGGGGGAGGEGSRTGGNGYAGANGGSGLQYSISGTSLFYSGGGGSGATTANGPSFGTIGTGGSGIGGNGGYYSPSRTSSTSGAANRGAGGGGGEDNSNGSSGGSGVVIVRYSNTFNDASISTGASFVNSGGFKIYTFTGNGSFRF